jgi:hypothetical protein
MKRKFINPLNNNMQKIGVIYVTCRVKSIFLFLFHFFLSVLVTGTPSFSVFNSQVRESQYTQSDEKIRLLIKKIIQTIVYTTIYINVIWVVDVEWVSSIQEQNAIGK